MAVPAWPCQVQAAQILLDVRAVLAVALRVHVTDVVDVHPTPELHGLPRCRVVVLFDFVCLLFLSMTIALMMRWRPRSIDFIEKNISYGRPHRLARTHAIVFSTPLP